LALNLTFDWSDFSRRKKVWQWENPSRSPENSEQHNHDEIGGTAFYGGVKEICDGTWAFPRAINEAINIKKSLLGLPRGHSQRESTWKETQYN